jgi:TetR/AcrR family transcriptional repressor of nem operon
VAYAIEEKHMKKSKKETAETRRHIVKEASSRFRENGVAGTGIADLMTAAGLTHGGFYKHFQSKDQLVEEALTSAAEALVHEMEQELASAPGIHGLHAMLRWYLSSEHCDDLGSGCALAALGSELARSGEGVREIATAGFLRMVDVVAGRLEREPAAAKKEAIFLVATMIGAVTMARIASDPALSKSILRESYRRLALAS